MAKKINPNQLQFNFDEIVIEEVEKDFIIYGCKHNIKKYIPRLLDTQAEDVSQIENTFSTSKGYLITNGTGTGKTYVGLGIIKRFYDFGRKEILIVTPTDKKCKDWIEEGETLNLKINQLEGTKDSGFEITVTTYANFYQNEPLGERIFDLVVYDESHYLNQNSKGEITSTHIKHKWVTNLPSTAKIKAEEIYSSIKPENELIDHNLELYKELIKEYNFKVKEHQLFLYEKTKVLFLSATPFAYHKSLQYGDGILWNIHENLDEKEYFEVPYNTPKGFDKFLVDNFGYRMRNNQCSIPESGVDVGLMERNFFEKMKEKGIMSTRQLELPYDYSREFVILESTAGEMFDEGFKLFLDNEFQKKYTFLGKHYKSKFNYLFMNKIFESFKAAQVSERIYHHLKLNRKVVLFHSYNNNNVYSPFKFDVSDFVDPYKANYNDINGLKKDIKNFSIEYSKYWNWDLSYLKNSIESLKDVFPNMGFVNGTISKKKRSEYINMFNDDDSGLNLIMVQQSAGKEGISLHDKTGRKPRVLLNIGLPVQPVVAIQIEGRIYREGLKSNAIYEYCILNTVSERISFATKIAERSRTVENLALGNLARNLEIAFKEGYINANNNLPSLEQGTGGLALDRNFNSISEFEKAITYYYSKQKTTSKNKSKLGFDYYATPEPLGYMMVKWLNPKENDHLLEPSSGHGAIARFFPGFTVNQFIEPSSSLFSETTINANGNFHNINFEDYHIINKFNGILMNPPFGSHGKLAYEHVLKATTHMDNQYSTILAIVPEGNFILKYLPLILNNKKGLKLTGEILLPSCTFERAGTSILCRLIRLQYANIYIQNYYYKEFVSIDLRQIESINEFFKEIENVNF